MAIIGAIAAVSGTAYSVSQQRKSNKAQRAASRASQRQQELKAARSRRIAFRELQRKRATAQATAAALGASGGSGAAGGLASLTSQYGADLGYGSAMTGLSKEITSFSSLAQQSLANAQSGAAVSGLGLAMVQNPVPFTNVKDTIFGKN